MAARQPTLRTCTHGCKVNQYETEVAQQALLGSGYRQALEGEVAQLCLINTCTVTAEGDAKGRQAIRKMARENPGARIAVMGCYASRAPDEVASLPGVTDILTDKRELPDWLARFGVTHPPQGLSGIGQRKRAYIKVQDGCLLRCSFCIIPTVRPHFESRPLTSIVDEVRTLVDGGRREVILTGIHLGHYGVEWSHGKPKQEWMRLAQLVDAIRKIPGDFRIRLSSIEATEVTRELLSVMAEQADKVCSHLHVCLQSGSDAVLRRMRRRWGAKRIIDRCLLAAQHLDIPGFSTDVIVGFPGETDQDFQNTLDALKEIGCFRIHAFPFSRRAGTDAASMTDIVPAAEVNQRMEQLRLLEGELRNRYFHQLAGKRLQVIVEGEDLAEPGMLIGSSCRYPTVRFQGSTPPGEFADVFAAPASSPTEFLPGVLAQ